ncbi:hypothetical protein ABE29_19580 [Cytobacillus firmus]|nr:hypothetical protein [Cytobacillus firmus]MBG9554187.1 hypothetical protein [Cytobacillus firmus]SUV01186.1 Uncharacterised protein [Cytobacillus firmus]
MKIIAVHEHPHLLDSAVQFFWEKWGTEENFTFYQDCMIHSGKTEDGIPRFYAAIQDEQIIGTYALIRNDLNSRQDLHPWLACLYIDPDFRGKQLGARSLDLKNSIFRRIWKGIMKNTAGRIEERCTGRAAAPFPFMKRGQERKKKRSGRILSVLLNAYDRFPKNVPVTSCSCRDRSWETVMNS